jgi:chemotaxis signal transduction protein
MTTTARAGSYLTLCLGNEEYGIPITQVREIIGVQSVVPNLTGQPWSMA